MMYVESSLESKQVERVADKERAITTGGAVSFLRQGVTQPLLQTLRSEEARLEQERAELAANLGENHPKILNKNSQIETVRKMTSEEVQRILSDLEAEIPETERADRVAGRSSKLAIVSYPRHYHSGSICRFDPAGLFTGADAGSGGYTNPERPADIATPPDTQRWLSAGNAEKPVVGAAGVDCRSRTYELHGS